MYFLFFVIIVFMIFFFINHIRKKRIICKIRSMSFCDKYKLLNRLSTPFGFCYNADQDIFATSPDAWQKTLGYGALYDRTALSLNMIFDIEPVYFNYDKKTWLIQFQKGQYGISTGAEVGICHASGTIAPALRRQTIFTSVSESEMMPVEIQLFFQKKPLFTISRTHWWMTGFCMGFWAPPSALSARIAITFPNTEMSGAFIRALTDLGYRSEEFYQDSSTVHLLFTHPKTALTELLWLSDWRETFTLRRTKTLCSLFMKVTAPFCCTLDRILFLYFYLPAAFRKTICIQSFISRRKSKN